MFHEALDAWLGDPEHRVDTGIAKILEYSFDLVKQYAPHQEEITFWTKLCALQFKAYIEFRLKNRPPGRKEILQEETFRVPYKLPDGRTVLLRGKYDSIHLVPSATGRSHSLYLEENKTKKYISERRIAETLPSNLQSMIYIVTISQSLRKGYLDNLVNKEMIPIPENTQIGGISYQIIRRPLEEKMPIRQRKSETQDDFLQRVALGFKEDPGYYFYPIKCVVTKSDIHKFCSRILDPLLTEICDWWDWIKEAPFDPWTVTGSRMLMRRGLHFQMPWGVYNSLFNGFDGDFYELLSRGFPTGLTTVTDLFPELD